MFKVRRAKGKDPAARGSGGKPDPWQTAIYAFEDDWPDWNKGTITLRQVRELVRLACAAYNFKAPPVRQHQGRGMTFSLDDGSLISFRLDHKNKPVALHEAAHFICDRLHGRRAQDHGPQWQGIYFFPTR